MASDAYNSAHTGAKIDEAVSAVLQNKDTWSGKQDKLTFDSTPTENSTNPVTSGGVYKALGDIGAILDSINGEVV